MIEKKERKPVVVITGSPNVGKSVVFTQLTGIYTTVSNYPGTTVEITKGKMKSTQQEIEVVDTPGLYSLIPITTEEKVARDILFNENVKVIVHVVDGKNLDRLLILTLQLIETKIPCILLINMFDEVEHAGIDINIDELKKRLGIPVIPSIAIQDKGMRELREEIEKIIKNKNIESKILNIDYGKKIEHAIDEISNYVKDIYKQISPLSLSLLLLSEDKEFENKIKEMDEDIYKNCEKIITDLKEKLNFPLHYYLTLTRHNFVREILSGIIKIKKGKKFKIAELMSNLMINPLSGIPILIIILYFAFYKFVGELGAGKIVDIIETKLFEETINPFLHNIFTKIIPWKSFSDLFVGEYGIFTLGIKYAIAIVLPIVSLFFLVFSIIEDSGYLPRISLLSNRLFKKIGLSGRAVIPVILGLGCDTMATMTTRILETKRERIIVVFLLSLAIPCSAQLGVIMAILAERKYAILLWTLIILAIFILSGTIVDKIIGGKRASFYIEVPPLRIPQLKNVISKTFARLKWYFFEIIPLFIYASIFIWLGVGTGIFDLITGLIKYPVQWIGLPPEGSKIFLYGFFRRDFGAAGLYDLAKNGILDGNQLLISAITLTLFIPCIAQFLMVKKELGWKITLLITSFIFPFAFFIGFLVNKIFL